MKAFTHIAAATILAAGAALTLTGAPALASSHRDAPSIIDDRAANITDTFAFRTPGDTVTLAFTVIPFEEPAEGPLWPNFDHNVLYEIHVERAKMANGQPTFTGKPDVTYQFRFSNLIYPNTNTILTEGRGSGLDAGAIMDVGDKHQNLIQTYTVTRVDSTSVNTFQMNPPVTMTVPPPNVGPHATPFYNDATGLALQGATSTAQLDKYTQEATYSLGGGRQVFCGQRDDPFFFDEGGTFDLLNIRKPGLDSFAGFNVHAIVIQVPISDLVPAGGVPMIGVYANTSRRRVTVRRGAPGEPSFSAGRWQSIQREGNPLFNEVFVPLKDKDRYSQSLPGDDGDESFRTYAENPEVAILANAVLLGSATPATGPIPTTGRTDLSAIFIPDLLKLDLSTPPVPLAGQAGFNRLSVFGGDTVMSTLQNKAVPSGWPNGKRPGDDVIDIALTALAKGTPVGDNVDSNDVPYPTVFPYLATPHSGFNRKHS